MSDEEDGAAEARADAEADAEVRRKAARVRARGRRPGLFRHLAHVGVLGWVFILPVVGLTWAGHLVGQWIGALWPGVAGLLSGVALGAYLTWRNVSDELRGDGRGDGR